MSTTTADPGQTERMTRRTSGKPAPVSGQLNFNPLHPSMELPPEQLIRLLGLEHKTKRRKKKSRQTSPVSSTRPHTTEGSPASKPVKLSIPRTTPASAERERDIVAAPFGDSPKRLVVSALIVGAIAGIAISAYLFWGGSEQAVPETKQTTPAAAIKKAVRPLPKSVKPVPASVPAAAPVPAPASVPTLEPVSLPATRQGIIQRDNVIPQEAEQRFPDRVSEQENVLPASTMSDDIPDPASMQTDNPVFIDEPIEVPVTSSDEPQATASPLEPASFESQNEILNDEDTVGEVPAEQPANETVLTPAEGSAEISTEQTPTAESVLEEPAVETTPIAAEPETETTPGAVQDSVSETTNNEALF